MDERGGVHHLECCGGLQGLVGDTTADGGRQEHENGAQLLAALGMDVVQDLGEQLVVGL